MRRELAELRRQAEAARDDGRIRSLEVELQGARRQLDRAQQEIGRRGGEAEAGRQRVEAMSRELGELRTRAVGDETRMRALEAELARASQDLLRTRQDVERRTGEARVEQQRTEDLRRELERLQKQAEAARDDPRIKSLEAQLGQRQAEVDREGQEVTRLRQRVATLEAEAERERQRLTAVRDDRVAMAGPTIEMIEPSLLTTRGVAVVKVSLAAEPRERVIVGKVTAPAGLMLLTINDREETPDSNGLFRAKIPVQASSVPIRLVAVDRQGKRGGIEFRMAPDDASGGAPAPAPKKRMPSLATGQYYALIIGNKTYSHWPSLRTAEVDARKTAELLEGKYGFKTRVLLNAGRYAILQALNELRNQLTEKDNLLIYYAGHGYLDEKINRAYWIPVDGQLDSNVDWIPTVAITDLVSAMSAKQILLVVDSCYSGALTRSALARLEAGMSDEARQHWLEVMAAKRSRTVLASGDVKPVLDIGGGQHSVFARAWLDVLTNNEDVLEGQRLYREIAARVAYAADALKFEQVPQYAPIRFAGHESGDFLFVPRDN